MGRSERATILGGEENGGGQSGMLKGSRCALMDSYPSTPRKGVSRGSNAAERERTGDGQRGIENSQLADQK